MYIAIYVKHRFEICKSVEQKSGGNDCARNMKVIQGWRNSCLYLAVSDSAADSDAEMVGRGAWGEVLR